MLKGLLRKVSLRKKKKQAVDEKMHDCIVVSRFNEGEYKRACAREPLLYIFGFCIRSDCDVPADQCAELA